MAAMAAMAAMGGTLTSTSTSSYSQVLHIKATQSKADTAVGQILARSDAIRRRASQRRSGLFSCWFMACSGTIAGAHSLALRSYNASGVFDASLL